MYYKYPKTPHLPWSPGVAADDIRVIDTSHFNGKQVVVSVKKDGESTTVYADGKVHARSIDSNSHISRDWIKKQASIFAHELPERWRVSLENLYAEHTIHYYHLKSYAEVIAIWDEDNICLPWKETKEWCQLLNLQHVDILYEGVYNEVAIKNLYNEVDSYGDVMEGYVVRVSDPFRYELFPQNVAKFVSARFRKEFENVELQHWLEKHKFGVITNDLMRSI